MVQNTTEMICELNMVDMTQLNSWQTHGTKHKWTYSNTIEYADN